MLELAEVKKKKSIKTFQIKMIPSALQKEVLSKDR